VHEKHLREAELPGVKQVVHVVGQDPVPGGVFEGVVERRIDVYVGGSRPNSRIPGFGFAGREPRRDDAYRPGERVRQKVEVRLMGVEGKNAQGIRLSQELLEKISLRDLRFGGGLVFPLNGFEDLVPVNGDMPGCGNAYFDVSSSQAQDGNLYLIPDDEAFTLFARED
jgi:hypothetical protein